MEYEQVLANTLPTLNGLVKERVGIGSNDRFCLFGPTRDHLREHAPDILQELANSENENLHFPYDQLSIESALRIHDDWTASRNWYAIIALPPDLDVFDSLSKDFRSFPNGRAVVASPNLILASLLGGEALTMCAAQYSDFVSDEFEPFRKEVGSRIYDFPYALHWTGVLGEGKCSLKFQYKQINYGGLLPSFVWRFDSSDSNPADPDAEFAAIAGFGWNTLWFVGAKNLPKPVHVRDITPRIAKNLSADSTHARALFDIATGSHVRGDDDSFIPLHDMAVKGYWGTDVDRFVDIQHDFKMRLRGPLMTIEEACKSVTEIRDWSTGDELLDSIWCPLDGSSSGIPHRWAPNRDGATRAATIKCDSANDHDIEYLGRCLTDGIVRVDIICRASGSLQEPIIRPRVLRETLIPWPTEEKRKRAIKEYDQLIRDAEHAEELAEALRDELKTVHDRLELQTESNRWSLPPRCLEGVWKRAIDSFVELDKTLILVANLLRPRDDVAAIERELHRAILNRLKQEFGEDSWWVDGIPLRVRTNAATAREEDSCRSPLEAYFYLLGMSEIVSKNWGLFGPAFERVLGVQGKKNCESWFVRVNKERNMLAHPIHGDIPAKSQEFLQRCKKQIQGIVSALGGD